MTHRLVEACTKNEENEDVMTFPI